jgi:hypothetical protein
MRRDDALKALTSAEIRALFHEMTGYCATPRARARAAWLTRQEEKQAREIARKERLSTDPETK